MAAPRKYSDAQRAAMFALYRQGCTPAEISRQCEAGLVSVAPFSIPRRTVQSIVGGMAHELGNTGAQPDSALSLEERINDMARRLIGLVEREIHRSERAQGTGRRVDKQTAAELTKCVRTLAPLAQKVDQRTGVAVRARVSDTGADKAQEESLLDRLARQMNEEAPDLRTGSEAPLYAR